MSESVRERVSGRVNQLVSERERETEREGGREGVVRYTSERGHFHVICTAWCQLNFLCLYL